MLKGHSCHWDWVKMLTSNENVGDWEGLIVPS